MRKSTAMSRGSAPAATAVAISAATEVASATSSGHPLKATGVPAGRVARRVTAAVVAVAEAGRLAEPGPPGEAIASLITAFAASTTSGVDR